MDADITQLDARVMLAEEGKGGVHQYRFMRTDPTPSTAGTITVDHGAVVARGEDGPVEMAVIVAEGRRKKVKIPILLSRCVLLRYLAKTQLI